MCRTRDEQFYNPYTERVENKWAAFEIGEVLSRQNGKNSVLEARELAGLYLFGERLIVHTAHQFDTSQEAFARILMLIENTPDLESEVRRISRSHGEEGIELKSGQRLRFRTRTKGGGRGFTADCVIFDEAMYLGPLQVGAILPTLSARPNPQLIYTGSAGDRNSTQLGRVRSRGIKGTDPRLLYMEWSIEPCNFFCPPDCDQHDPIYAPASYAKANPGMGIRIDLDHIEAEARSMDEETFKQERLGVGDWPVEGDGWLVIPKDAWEARKRPEARIVGKFALAVDTAPDRSWTCIAAAGPNAFGDTTAEMTGREGLYDYRQGISWAADRVVEIWNKQHPPFVVVDPASPAGSMIEELESRGVKVISPSARDYAQACGDFKTGIAPRAGEGRASINHVGQAPLTTAVAAADKRDVADLWAWNKRESASDITPLTAATHAVWGYKKHIYKKSAAPWVAYQ